ncbi:MarR family winged helix-turn-helix transcriptional regulator [Micromonospora sp. HM5-17]|jgi:DNA-binding MarR family transcriptional regulator|uniref:MarR family winged helix-turn-helix transcriptional regulator n=1 Tax=Micromonospora sp. HM5-17 TaxID=2487710 RepID=UPI000F4670B2|nr:MarR family winged helix-turn-helix transcriptional regulator [Micromonospora sp. HM5-17]ROT32441.1 MarR family transcriptional regulator [Micromonospora sp. HM5-17]
MTRGGRASAERLGLLLARHGVIANHRLRQVLASTGLTPRHGMALTHLAETGSVTQQRLLELLRVDPSVLVTLLNELEAEGFVRRRRDPADRRRHIVEITPTGTAALRKVESAVDHVERDLFAGFTAEQTRQLHALLSQIRTSPGDPACTEE